MKISTKGRYAFRMMIDIANHSNGEWVTIKEISKRQGISVKYLEQIVNSLTKAGLLRSGRGSSGGYMLSKSPEQYTIGQILRIIEGKLAPVSCLENDENLCERKEYCVTLSFWEGLYKVIEEYADSFTLQDFINSK